MKHSLLMMTIVACILSSCDGVYISKSKANDRLNGIIDNIHKDSFVAPAVFTCVNLFESEENNYSDTLYLNCESKYLEIINENKMSNISNVKWVYVEENDIYTVIRDSENAYYKKESSDDPALIFDSLVKSYISNRDVDIFETPRELSELIKENNEEIQIEYETYSSKGTGQLYVEIKYIKEVEHEEKYRFDGNKITYIEKIANGEKRMKHYTWNITKWDKPNLKNFQYVE